MKINWNKVKAILICALMTVSAIGFAASYNITITKLEPQSCNVDYCDLEPYVPKDYDKQGKKYGVREEALRQMFKGVILLFILFLVAVALSDKKEETKNGDIYRGER